MLCPGTGVLWPAVQPTCDVRFPSRSAGPPLDSVPASASTVPAGQGKKCASVKVLVSQSVSRELSLSFLDLKHKNATRLHYMVDIYLPMQTSLRIGNKCP